MLYLLNHMNVLTLNPVLLCKNNTNTYAKNDAESSKWLNALLIAYSMEKLNIRVNEKFDLLSIIDKGGIVRLNLMLDEMLFMSEAVVKTLNTWLTHFTQEVSSKTV